MIAQKRNDFDNFISNNPKQGLSPRHNPLNNIHNYASNPGMPKNLNSERHQYFFC